MRSENLNGSQKAPLLGFCIKFEFIIISLKSNQFVRFSVTIELIWHSKMYLIFFGWIWIYKHLKLTEFVIWIVNTSRSNLIDELLMTMKTRKSGRIRGTQFKALFVKLLWVWIGSCQLIRFSGINCSPDSPLALFSIEFWSSEKTNIEYLIETHNITEMGLSLINDRQMFARI